MLVVYVVLTGLLRGELRAVHSTDGRTFGPETLIADAITLPIPFSRHPFGGSFEGNAGVIHYRRTVTEESSVPAVALTRDGGRSFTHLELRGSAAIRQGVVYVAFMDGSDLKVSR